MEPSTPAAADEPAKAPSPPGHFQRYAKAYLVGIVFVLVQALTAITGEFDGMKAADIAALTRFEWFLRWCAAAASALTTILAFLNPARPNNETPPGTSSS